MHKIVEEIQTDYIDCGEGAFVFLLHGWGSNKELFAPITTLLSTKYRVIAPDLPGFGKTEEPPEHWDLGSYVDFVIRFIESFRAEHVILLGHSFGGRILIKMASRTSLPFTIDKMILTGSAGILPKRSAGYYMRTHLYKMGKAFLGCAPVRKVFPNALPGLQKKMGSSDYAAASPVMRSVFVRVVNEDLAPLLPKIREEVLLVWGENDTATPLTDGMQMEREIPDAGLAKIAGAGHYAWLDQPHIFGSILKSYLKIN
ncbi:MAG: alpha/beta hydrolase [Clostridiales bacterium]|jgi:pimeloyl-ACP methyl ester carboxylesterase|nr:alpha/beta hydrolase [Clostridiales bacterium]